MARTIGPGTPTAIEPVNVKIPDIDLSDFEKIGDSKIKAATQNFQLYATTTANAEAQKAYAKYKDNPIALANALSKLPGMFKDLPESIQTELKQKLDTNAISLVTKAQANQEKAINKQNKALAHANAILNTQQISDDYFNVLRYITSTEEEKRPVDLAIYRQHRNDLRQMTNLTDENGIPLFTESQRNKMLMPKEATVIGAKQFINRMELDQLQEWDKKIFQNQRKFMEDTDIDADTYETIETYIKTRMQALKDTTKRELHGQAYYDQINLITEPTKLNIEKAKSYDFTDDDTIDKIVKKSKELTLAKYYDPMRRTAPDAFIQAYNIAAEAITNTDWSPEGRELAVAQTYTALAKLQDLAEQTNLDPESVYTIRETLRKALWDRETQAAILSDNIGLKTWLEQSKKGWENKEYKIYSKSGSEAMYRDYTGYRHRARQTKDAMEKANELAMENYGTNLRKAIPYLLTNDYAGYQTAMAYAAKQAKKDRASFIVQTKYEWNRLEKELAEGKKPIVTYNGMKLEFKGFDNEGALFEEII